MKTGATVIALAILAATGVAAFLANIYLSQWTKLQTQEARDAAVDGCMQNAKYTWQATNQQNPQFTNTTSEPDRYWYKLCMQEKGYQVVAEL